MGVEVKSFGLRMEDSRREVRKRSRGYGGILISLFALEAHPLGLLA